MKKHYYLIILFVIAFIDYANSQGTEMPEVLDAKTTKNYIGVNAGYTTGLGFSYRFMPQKTGIQITGIPIVTDETFFYSVGTTFLRQIKQYKDARFLFYTGAHLTNFNWDNYLNAGFGAGFDYNFALFNAQSPDFVFNFMIGYMLFEIGGDIQSYPTAETGLFFKF